MKPLEELVDIPRECPRCGAPVGEGDKFCTQCGQGLEEEARKGIRKTFVCEDVGYVSTGTLINEAVTSMLQPSRVKLPPSCAIYATRPSKPLGRYIFAGATMLVTGLSLGYGGEWLSYIGYTLAGYAAPLIYLAWMLRNDRYEREPAALVAFTFGWGAFCSIFAAVLNVLVANPLLGPPGASFVEEPLKLLGVYILARSSLGSEFNDHMDGMVYGAAAGAGFAGLENLFYILNAVVNQGVPAASAILIRSATAFGHIAWTGMAGRSLGLAKAIKGSVTASDMIPGLIVAVFLHFLWNASNPFISLFLILPITAITFTRQVRAARMDELDWGYGTQAPVE